jgi:purine-nucleoside phosphorylase
MTPDLFTRAESAAAFVLSQTQAASADRARAGLGLGSFADDLTERAHSLCRHSDVSAFDGGGTCRATRRRASRAKLPVAVMQGRVHLYEGYPAAEVAFPTRVLGRMLAYAL